MNIAKRIWCGHWESCMKEVYQVKSSTTGSEVKKYLKLTKMVRSTRYLISKDEKLMDYKKVMQFANPIDIGEQKDIPRAEKSVIDK